MISLSSIFLKARVIVGVTLLTIVGLFPTVQLNKPADKIIQKITGITKIKDNELQRLFDQARSLKKYLPPDGWIHFNTDITIFERNTILEHALSPLIFDNNPSHIWWIGNYNSQKFKAQAIKKYQLKEIRTVGKGLTVLKKQTP